ncbi:sodium channel protein Nach-like [Cylas formicarius]|uniref:sodium channel protein Nach-like n=1 Tax=Cylas formicarius TaxID=197179 RepID=UPI002958DDE4|nr:sodium channel protein Nach-like [Cylas formicarius]
MRVRICTSHPDRYVFPTLLPNASRTLPNNVAKRMIYRMMSRFYVVHSLYVPGVSNEILFGEQYTTAKCNAANSDYHRSLIHVGSIAIMFIAGRFISFCKNTSLPGLKFIVDRDRPLTLRLLWSFMYVAHIAGMFAFIISLFKSYNEDAVSFLTETAYLDWNTSFPAITVCQISVVDFPPSEDYDLDETEKDNTPIEFFIADVSFFSGTCYSCQSHCPTCSKLNISNIVRKIRQPCEKLLQKCMWNNVEFDCCEKFLPLETEYGICYSINSLHTQSTPSSEINLLMNRKTGIGKMSLKTNEDVRVYYHAAEDVPFINSEPSHRKDVMVGEEYNILFKITEIENDETLRKLTIRQRRCRFPWENPKNVIVHKFYSYSTCIVQCHADNQIRLCNCTHHLMPVYNKEKYCDIFGLRCLTDNFETLNRIRAPGSDSKPGLTCDCLPSCTEPELKIISETKEVGFTNGGINIKMQSLPTSRFKRVVVRSPLELVVSIGGAAGLFMGASILSVVEILYLLFVKNRT